MVYSNSWDHAFDPERVSERCIVEAGGKLLYVDANHLNIDGSLFLYPPIERELDKFLAAHGLAKDRS